MNAVYMWLGAIVLFAIIEALTVGIVSIWFCIGSLGALIAAALGASVTVQIFVFLALSVAALIATRPLIKKKLLLKTTPTNFDMLIGESGITEEIVNNIDGTGAVKIQGKVWSAKSDDGEVIPTGSIVTVLRIEGVKLIVRIKE